MKRIMLLAALAAWAFCSCGQKDTVVAEEEPIPSTSEKEGSGPSIELDKADVVFPAEGGEETVTALNCPGWWINYGYEDAKNVAGVVRYVNFVTASRSGNDAQVPDVLEGGWYHAVVPDKGLSNQLVITVDPNTTDQPRKATIQMQAADIFPTVSISQQ